MSFLIPRSALFICALLPGLSALAATTHEVKASRRPSEPGKPMAVRLLEDLPDFKSAPAHKLSRYGGDMSRPGKATGFFRVERDGQRWWMVDPEGYRYFQMAMNTVRPGTAGSVASKASLVEKFGDEAGWATATTELLRARGFNSTGAWSAYASLRGIKQPMPYTVVLHMMNDYRAHRKGVVMEGKYERFLGGVPFVFDPEFEPFARKLAAAQASRSDDPWLVGIFSDNELPFPRDALDRYLSLPAVEPGHQAAQTWRRERFAGAAGKPLPEITDEERDAFLHHVVDRYYEIARRVIKQVLPNHLYLGSRLHARATFNAGVWNAAAPHVDVLSTNVYGSWTPPVGQLRKMVASMGKPFMVTEWYAKGADSGLANVTGAGWFVPTQADRGRFYHHFLLALLESGGCVGSHWFCYMDNDPADTSAGPSNIDSNKGIVTIRHEPYVELLDAMQAVNDQKYRLIDYFDQRGR